jgi:hypothetical protein
MTDFSKMSSQDKADSVLADYIKSQIRTFIIAKVVKVYASTQRVDVQPCITVKVEDKNSTTKIYTRIGKKVGVSELEMPVILDVPISYLRTGTFMVTLPLQVGTYGKLLFSNQDISEWKIKGGTGVEQKNLAQFNINNCVFEPYIASDPDVVSDYNPDALEVRAGEDKLTMAGDGKIVANCDIEIDGISFLDHFHGVPILEVFPPGTPVVTVPSANTDTPED